MSATPPYIASFDSASGMLLALSRHLHGHDFPLLDALPPAMAPVMRGEFLGVDEGAYPRDFAVFARYHEALKRRIRSRYPRPAPLPLAALDDFLAAQGERYRVRWLDA